MKQAPNFASNKFNNQLIQALGLQGKQITELVVTCKAGELTTIQCTELIIGDASVDKISRTFDLIDRNDEVGKSLTRPVEK